ncbi:MAG: formylglycine-generating enzyme family protein, partial [Proteobacteria bacterium]|nr:formylglycine-generating enzyme family protein [Pseudomonadota bacterium]
QVEAAEKIGKPVVITNSIGMKFVLIPAGSFMMGSPPDELERGRPDVGGLDEEGPVHRVKISRPFYLQTTVVTQAQFFKIMGKNPSEFKRCKRCPVEQVSWQDAREFIRRLNAREKTKKYRLPTEAEWEYACRAGTRTPFYFGQTISTNQANYNGRQVYGKGRKGVWRRKTTPVGRFSPNRWGLYDMHGNVWEWCRDQYHYAYYKKSPPLDPPGPNFTPRDSTEDNRVLRGGSWRNHPRSLRSARREPGHPTDRSEAVGFRVVRDL